MSMFSMLLGTNGCFPNEPCKARTTKGRSVRSLSTTANLRLCKARCYMWSFCLGNFRRQWIRPLGFCLKIVFFGGLEVETIWMMVEVISLPFSRANRFVARLGFKVSKCNFKQLSISSL